MPIAQRNAVTTWTGPLASGTGTVTGGSGEAAGLCPVSRLFAGARIGVEALLEPN